MITALMLMKAELKEIANLTKALAEFDEITELYTTTGEYDVVAKVMVEDLDALAGTVTEKMAGLEGIVKTSTLLAIRCHSEQAMDRMFGVGFEEEGA